MEKKRAVKRQQRCARRRMGLRRFIKSSPYLLLIMAMALPAMAETGAGEKLAGGIKDTATGWVEVPQEMAETTEDSNILAGATEGTVKGAGQAILKTTKGAVDVATFYIPENEDNE
jgi:putative exosortase-associated protein (TIGR04073 family)